MVIRLALDKVKVEEKILKLVPEDVAMKHRVLPLRKVGRTLTVAMANPTDMGAIDNLKFITRYEIEPVIVGEYTLQKFLEDYYGLGDSRMEEMLGDLLDAGQLEILDGFIGVMEDFLGTSEEKVREVTVLGGRAKDGSDERVRSFAILAGLHLIRVALQPLEENPQVP